jgi:hypothetical protein
MQKQLAPGSYRKPLLCIFPILRMSPQRGQGKEERYKEEQQNFAFLFKSRVREFFQLGIIVFTISAKLCICVKQVTWVQQSNAFALWPTDSRCAIAIKSIRSSGALIMYIKGTAEPKKPRHCAANHGQGSDKIERG